MTAIALKYSRRLVLSFGAAALTLGGCESIIGPPAAPRIYRLAPAFAPQTGGARVTWQLAVANPNTMHTLDTQRIALSRGETMDYYADAEWNDTVPRLLQSLLVEAFETSGRIAAVAPESESLRADYLLTTDIRDFEAQYESNGAPVATIDIEAKLLDVRGHVLASADVRKTAQAAANSIPAAVTAFDEALSAALAQIVSWTLASVPAG